MSPWARSPATRWAPSSPPASTLWASGSDSIQARTCLGRISRSRGGAERSAGNRRASGAAIGGYFQYSYGPKDRRGSVILEIRLARALWAFALIAALASPLAAVD